MRQRHFEVNGTVAWLVFALLITALATGCHGDTNQGGGADKGHAAASGVRQPEQRIPTPPTADQIDPNSPQAVLHGTSTTQPGTQAASGSRAPAPR